MPWAFKENRPIFQQIYDTIVIRILNGTYPQGGQLPSVREMAEEAGVNPNTMQRAMSQLESAGLALTNRTSGRIVTSDEELLKKVSRNGKLLKEKLLTKLLWGTLASLLGIGLIGLGAWLGYVGGGGVDDPMAAACFGLIALGVGIAFLINYFIGKRMLAKKSRQKKKG